MDPKTCWSKFSLGFAAQEISNSIRILRQISLWFKRIVDMGDHYWLQFFVDPRNPRVENTFGFQINLIWNLWVLTFLVTLIMSHIFHFGKLFKLHLNIALKLHLILLCILYFAQGSRDYVLDCGWVQNCFWTLFK